MDTAGDFSAYAGARWGNLVRSAVFLGCSLQEAQDLAQTTLMRCFVAWPKVQRADDRDAYVYRVLLNCLRESRRRRWWGENPSRELPDAAVTDRFEEVDVTDAVHRALSGLNPSHREVVVLRYLLNLTEHQTAEVLGVRPGTVKSRLSRAVALLAANPHLLDLKEDPTW